MPKGEDLEGYARHIFADKQRYTGALVTKFVINNDDRRECLKFLNKMNINRASLFPDLDGAGCYVNTLWEMDFDSSVGRLLTTLTTE